MDELQLDFSLDELESLKKMSYRYAFPVIYVGKSSMLFNAHSAPIIPEKVKWFSTGEYIIGLPADASDMDAFTIRSYTGSICKATTLPAAMKEKKVKKGCYKLYKYKTGFAFKRYEPLGETT